jgi:DNA-directed RNA polymerase specialized sigma24 family protein
MAKTELYQAEMDTTLANVSPTLERKNNPRLLLNFESSQNIISTIVTSRISCTSYDLISPEERSALINDVTQNTWMKLLLATKARELEITSPAGYVASAARSESIDEIRRRKRKRTFPLPLDQDGELSQGKVLFPVQQGMRDPAIAYELKEWITEVIDVVVQLPQKQVYAIVCAMKDEVEDTALLAELFRAHRIDIASMIWPQDPKELQRLRSLLSVARRTLREKFMRPPAIKKFTPYL